MKEEWLVIANHYVAVNVAEVMYTSPVVPREFLGLKMGMITLAGRFLIFFGIFVAFRARTGLEPTCSRCGER